MRNVQNLPPDAEAYADANNDEALALAASLAFWWRRLGSDFDRGWTRIGPKIVETTTNAQTRSARRALDYIPRVMLANGMDVPGTTTAQTEGVPGTTTRRPRGGGLPQSTDKQLIVPDRFSGYNGGQYPLENYLRRSITVTRTGLKNGKPFEESVRLGEKWLRNAAQSAVSDAGRSAERVAMRLNGAQGYIRMLTPPSCRRCVLLAGKFYWKQGFARHPKCDCRHVPAPEVPEQTDDMRVDMNDYFSSLSEEEQDKTFGKSAARAIREGADISQVVNSRAATRGRTQGSNVYVLDGVEYTHAGTSHRGAFGSQFPRGSKPKRLTVEAIEKVAGDNDEEYRRLLRYYRYI